MAVGPSSTVHKMVPGVRLAATHCGLKRKDLDLVLMEFTQGSTVAGVFTQSWFSAAPVKVSKQHLALGNPRCFLINSGNANAAVGEKGIEDALACCQALARPMGLTAQDVLPFSTGVIGERLPIKKIQSSLNVLVEQLREDNWLDAAKAIMTTDTRPKICSRAFLVNGKEVTLTGIAKGAGMIQPDMATLLVYLATDASLNKADLQQLLTTSVEKSFNRITIDSDTSTNDSSMLVATGVSDVLIKANTQEFDEFSTLLTEICVELATGIVKDAEGATKFVAVRVVNGPTVDTCLDVAYAIANSPLVKTAIFAGDANWGRIVMAIGKSRTRVEESKIDIYIGDCCLMEQGTKASAYAEEQGAAVMAEEEITITIDLNNGKAKETVWTSDLSYEYVKINSEYRT